MTVYKLKDIPKLERPREKLIKYGPQFLTNSELLAILIGTGYQGKNVLQLAKEILVKYQAKNLPKLTYQELVSQKGVGEASACRILVAFELSSRLLLDQDGEMAVISSPQDVYQLFKSIGGRKKEHFIGLYLDARNQVIYRETISIGSLNANIVHPREVFEPAIANHAFSLIVVHNHPSGSSRPSEDDLKVTKRLVKVGQLLGIGLIDHLIIVAKGFFSFKEEGLIS